MRRLDGDSYHSRIVYKFIWLLIHPEAWLLRSYFGKSQAHKLLLEFFDIFGCCTTRGTTAGAAGAVTVPIRKGNTALRRMSQPWNENAI